MLKSSKIFIGLNALLLIGLTMSGSWYIEYQFYIALILVILLGIPHGAVDHILFIKNTKSNTLKFYGFYLSFIVSILVLWLILPLWSMVFFLVISAYHFGQSQFSKFSLLIANTRAFLYASWGVSILSGLSLYNYEELSQLFTSSADIEGLMKLFEPSILTVVLISSSLCFFFLLIMNYRAFSKKQFGIEVLLFILIHISFYFHSLLLGFSLYFATLHSFQVLKEEYAFLFSKSKNFNFSLFLSKLIPYTIVSLIGIALLLSLSHFEIIPLSKTLLIFMSVSALTLPHSMVMENFYASVFKSN